MTFAMYVPTSTILARPRPDSYEVVMFRPTKKHGGKLVFPGGRLKMGTQDFMSALIAEWREEVAGNGAQLRDIQTFGIALDPRRDNRQVTLEKITHGECPAAVAKTELTGIYGCPDMIFTATFTHQSGLAPGDGEAAEIVLMDVRDFDYDDIGAGHDVIAHAYELWVTSGFDPAAKPDPASFCNFELYRQRWMSAI